MASCAVVYKEVRFVIEDELTHCYIRIDAIGDCPHMMAGWYHKVFPQSKSAIQILNEAFEAGGNDKNHPLFWDKGAP